MDHLGDGYFQIVNQDQTDGIKVIDNLGSTKPDSPVAQNTESVVPFAIGETDANQEWDIMTVGNCGDIPVRCQHPPLTALGDYYMRNTRSSFWDMRTRIRS